MKKMIHPVTTDHSTPVSNSRWHILRTGLLSGMMLMMAGLNASAQSVPVGFEDNTTNGWLGTATSETAVVNAAAGNVRTGSYSLKLTTTATSTGTKQWYSPNAYVTSGANIYVHYIFWAKAQDAGTSVDAAMRYSSSSLPSGTGSTANPATPITVALTTAAWTRVTNSITTTSVRYYYASPRKIMSTGATAIYYDDGIIYTAASAIPDTVKPFTPTALTGAASGNLVTLSWTSNTDAGGADASGVAATILLRTTNQSAPLPVLNDQGVYSVSGAAAGPNTVGDWTVINTTAGATATSYMDAVGAINTYKYAVVLRDVAYNYSVAAVSSNITTATPVPTVFVDTTGFNGSMGSTEKGLFSAEASYKVSGFNLAAPIIITAPAGFQVSLTSGAGFAATLSLPNTSGTVPSTTIYVRFAPTTASGATGTLNITNASGASVKNVPVSGNAIDMQPATTGSISFGVVRSTRIEVNLPTAGSGTRRIIVMNSTSDVTFIPVDGVAPTGVNSVFPQAADQGSGNRIVYDGTGSGNSVVLVTGLTPGTTYYFAVYEYNAGTGASQNYLPNSPVTAIARTADNDLAIGQQPGAASIKIYPNPTEGLINIQAPANTTVLLRDLTGRIVYNGRNVTIADIGALSGGVYMISLLNEKGQMIYSQQLLKSK